MLLSARRELRAISASALVCVWLVGCGSRTTLEGSSQEGSEVGGACIVDGDCISPDFCAPVSCIEGTCRQMGPRECAPSSACMVATCNSVAAACEESPRTPDLDGDGHHAPLPGMPPGAPGSCGDDCDDTRAAAFPGGFEQCDGVDNDCDGAIDNTALYLEDVVVEDGVIPLGSSLLEATAGRGIAHGGNVFALGYWGRDDMTASYVRGISSDPSAEFAERLVSGVSAPSFGVDLAWSGESFGAVWSDTRFDENYEVFFARFGLNGDKLGPDLRITTAEDFSVHSRVIYDQGRFVVVYDDHRGGAPQIIAQLLDPAGQPLGGEVVLSDALEAAEQPFLAASPTHYGLVYTVVSGTDVSVVFRAFDKNLGSSTGSITVVATAGRAPRIVSVQGLFLVTWDTYDTGPGSTIRGALYDASGELVGAANDLTWGATYARSHATLSLGDRVLLAWADDFDGNYELYAKVIGLDLGDLEPRVRLTQSDADTILPSLALGTDGKVGVLFDDWRSGLHGAYFRTLGCQFAPPTLR